MQDIDDHVYNSSSIRPHWVYSVCVVLASLGGFIRADSTFRKALGYIISYFWSKFLTCWSESQITPQCGVIGNRRYWKSTSSLSKLLETIFESSYQNFKESPWISELFTQMKQMFRCVQGLAGQAMNKGTFPLLSSEDASATATADHDTTLQEPRNSPYGSSKHFL